MSDIDIMQWTEERERKRKEALKLFPLLSDRQIEELIADGYELPKPEEL